MFGLGVMELGIIALILLLLFGAKRIPAVMGSIGEGIRELRNSFKRDEIEPGSAEEAEQRRRRREADRIER
jgi:sec-independent protein translocase protein TatA